ncbi:hypothetical protein Glove_621g58 [Diversispora epigaea]|uniref:Uncharacterized protein n=1 Tax=Diversispora epigaea TaxID=1348612 RepID=A0A397GA05_9GLOM|nr:hypothetical protein Glove_621g58 [Diversispora epigaea]
MRDFQFKKMLLWEHVFEKIPYGKWDIIKIKEHVLAGNREEITWGKAPPDPDNPTIRASLQDIFINLNHLVDEYCTPDKEITIPLLPDKELDLDGFRAVFISDEEGIVEHKKKEYAKTWECFLAHTDLDNATAKYWKGYYLWEGIEVEKDQTADEEIADAQLRYAFSLVDNPLVNFDRDVYLHGKLGKALNIDQPKAKEALQKLGIEN